MEIVIYIHLNMSFIILIAEHAFELYSAQFYILVLYDNIF
jgi:hypothetical protein